MLEMDMKYIGKVDGRKPHYIFLQHNDFYVFTQNDERRNEKKDTRGNFHKIYKGELNSVKKQLAGNDIPSKIDCNVIYDKIQGVYGSKKLRKNIGRETNKPDFFITRLRNIFYILAIKGYLRKVKEGNAIFFKKTSMLNHRP